MSTSLRATGVLDTSERDTGLRAATRDWEGADGGAASTRRRVTGWDLATAFGAESDSFRDTDGRVAATEVASSRKLCFAGTDGAVVVGAGDAARTAVGLGPETGLGAAVTTSLACVVLTALVRAMGRGNAGLAATVFGMLAARAVATPSLTLRVTLPSPIFRVTLESPTRYRAGLDDAGCSSSESAGAIFTAEGGEAKVAYGCPIKAATLTAKEAQHLMAVVVSFS